VVNLGDITNALGGNGPSSVALLAGTNVICTFASKYEAPYGKNVCGGTKIAINVGNGSVLDV